MPIRNLDTGDSIEVLDAGFVNPNASAFSLVGVIIQDTVAGGDRACLGIGDASGNGVTLGVNGDGLVYADDDEFEGVPGSPGMGVGEAWVVAMTKATTGIGPARLHAVELGGGSPFHANTTNITPTSFTPDRFTFGKYPGGTAAFDGKFVAAATFDVELSDQDIEDIAIEASTLYLESLSPHSFYEFLQPTIESDLYDLTGGGADQFAISGTDVVTGSDPAWTFGFGSFPTTAVLTNFTGADQDPITDDFSGPIVGGGSVGQLRRVSNALRGDTDGQSAQSYWDLADFGPDVEAFLTITTKDSDVDSFTGVFARLNDEGTSTPDGYAVQAITRSGTDEWLFYRIDNGTFTTIGPSIFKEFASGDSIGIQCIGNHISAWHKPSGGSWILLGTRIDGAYNSTGRIGIGVFRNGIVGTIMDDFGGGTVVTAPLAEKQSYYMRRRRLIGR